MKAAVFAAQQSASGEDIAKWLAALWLQTKKPGAVANQDFEEVLAAYYTALHRFPGELVREAITTWASRPKPKEAHHWWPSSGELADLVRERASDLAALYRAVEGLNLNELRRRRILELNRKWQALDCEGPRQEARSPTFRHPPEIADQLAAIDAEIRELQQAQGGGP